MADKNAVIVRLDEKVLLSDNVLASTEIEALLDLVLFTSKKRKK